MSLIRGDTRTFSWAWVVFEILGLLAAWLLVWLHLLPRVTLFVIGPVAAFGLLVEVSRYYRQRGAL